MIGVYRDNLTTIGHVEVLERDIGEVGKACDHLADRLVRQLPAEGEEIDPTIDPKALKEFQARLQRLGDQADEIDHIKSQVRLAKRAVKKTGWKSLLPWYWYTSELDKDNVVKLRDRTDRLDFDILKTTATAAQIIEFKRNARACDSAAIDSLLG